MPSTLLSPVGGTMVSTHCKDMKAFVLFLLLLSQSRVLLLLFYNLVSPNVCDEELLS